MVIVVMVVASWSADDGGWFADQDAALRQRLRGRRAV
jgi:hypothetical protein